MIEFVMYWLSWFFCGYSIGYDEDKYLLYAAVSYFAGLIFYLIHIIIDNPDLSLSGVSSSVWATVILFAIIFCGSAGITGYVVGRWRYNRKKKLVIV